jgi:DNA-binding NtrC family response regulator
MTASSSILVADDQPAVREALRILLANQGFSVELATSPREVLRLVREQEFGLALLDLNYARDTTSGEEGLELIQQLQKIEGAPPLVVMTAWATVDLAVAAMRHGPGTLSKTLGQRSSSRHHRNAVAGSGNDSKGQSAGGGEPALAEGGCSVIRPEPRRVRELDCQISGDASGLGNDS